MHCSITESPDGYLPSGLFVYLYYLELSTTNGAAESAGALFIACCMAKMSGVNCV